MARARGWQWAWLSLLGAPLLAAAIEPLSDSALATVAGRDGMNFNLSEFSLAGTAAMRFYTGNRSGSFTLGNLTASRSDNPDAFVDPYRFNIVTGSDGRADIMRMSLPENAFGHEVWQSSFALSVQADGRDVTVGSVVLKDMVYYGGGFEWTTPLVGEGLAFGIAVRSDLGSMSWRSNGVDDASQALVLSGVRIGGVDANGQLNGVWRLADASYQPGLFQARTDVDGNPSLHIGIGWASGQEAARGTLQVDNISFASQAGNVDLGASRIGAIQLNYLDIRFRP